MPKKGHKSTSGIGDIWGEPKNRRVNVVLTDTGKKQLEEKASQLGLSISELIERIARGQLVQQPDEFKKNWMNLWIRLIGGMNIAPENLRERS